MIPIMITDTCTALRQAAPLDSLFETFCNADTSAVANMGAAASGSLFDHLWPAVVEVIAIMLILSFLIFVIARISGRNPSPIELEVGRIKYVLMDIQESIDRNFYSLEEAVRESGGRSNTKPRRSTSQARRKKTAKDVSHSGASFTSMSAETKMQSHEEMQ